MTKMAYEQFVRMAELSYDVHGGESVIHEGWACYQYLVEITSSRAGYAEIPFRKGLALTDPPTLREVLECVQMDHVGYRHAHTFEDWCADYMGSDPDSRQAYSTYQQLAEQAAELEDVMGVSLFNVFVCDPPQGGILAGMVLDFEIEAGIEPMGSPEPAPVGTPCPLCGDEMAIGPRSGVLVCWKGH